MNRTQVSEWFEYVKHGEVYVEDHFVPEPSSASRNQENFEI